MSGYAGVLGRGRRGARGDQIMEITLVRKLWGQAQRRRRHDTGDRPPEAKSRIHSSSRPANPLWTQSMGDVLAYSGAMSRLGRVGKIDSDLRMLSMGRVQDRRDRAPAVQPRRRVRAR